MTVFSKIRLILNMFLIKINALALRTFTNRIISFSILALICFFVVKVPSEYKDAEIVSLMLFMGIYCFSTIRINDSVVFNLITRTTHMNLLYPKEYLQYSYVKDINYIKEMLKKQFIHSLIRFHHDGYGKKIVMYTHDWIVKNVINTKAVKGIYNVEIVNTGRYQTLIHETLLLITWKDLLSFDKEMLKRINKKREVIKVILTKKEY